MIPRYQRVLVGVLLGLSILMAAYLFYLHHRNQAATEASIAADDTPIAPVNGSAENVLFATVHDDDGTITWDERSVPLPTDPNSRARALLDHLLQSYAQTGSPHPVPNGTAVEDVFLIPLPLTPSNEGAGAALLKGPATNDLLTQATGELAVINLRSSWVNAHPSGVGPETLTVLSMLETLANNTPEITYVRFLVDGQPRDTLAGHASLRRTYDLGAELPVRQ